ncbi:Dirigent protein [Quillaja saponaria]|uniref:Dirigent protein n=1 Tax=Quillaja saponaria TaxID=32244 RepID=A0AAD7VHS6_QUISA|nr:Dirigent protein [Quillaja saponaria]
MAKIIPIPYTFFFFLTIILFLISTFATAISPRFSQNISPTSIGLKREGVRHLHFYFHETVGGQNATAVRVAQSPVTKTSSTEFGAVVVMDDPLTIGPELSSRIVGKAQGIYTFASQNEIGLLMVLNFVFTEGKYNGSTLSVLGRNAVLSTVREMPIVGGSGIFRFARGYAQARTHNLVNSNTVVVEYNVYVFHY